MMTAAEVRERAAEVRELGNATQEQRAELRALISQKCVTDEWKQRFYADVVQDGGLSNARATSTLTYLRRMPDRSDQPVYATDDQAEQMRKLVLTRVAPRRWITPLMDRLDAGTLTYDLADLTITNLRRQPLKTFIAPDRPIADGAPVPDAYYALRRGDGTVRHYRISTVGGMRRVDQITGTTNTARRRLHGLRAADVIKAVAADPIGAARLFGETRKRCSDCNQPIRENEKNPGFKHGYGPDCWDERQAIRRNADQRAEIDNDTPGEPVSLTPAGVAS